MHLLQSESFNMRGTVAQIWAWNVDALCLCIVSKNQNNPNLELMTDNMPSHRAVYEF